jgi:hypothetical protein
LCCDCCPTDTEVYIYEEEVSRISKLVRDMGTRDNQKELGIRRVAEGHKSMRVKAFLARIRVLRTPA